jgi:phosphohistidine phosphatase
MQILIIRHAPASDREEFASSGQADDLRPLTKKGKEKMRQNITGLQTIVPQIDRIVESPLVRAQQTAGLLGAAYSTAIRQTLPALAPDGSELEVLTYLQKYADTTTIIALVGHEPNLGELATWLLSGQTGSWIPLKKGSACLLEFSGEVKAGEAELLWMLRPKQLRQLTG